MLYFIFLVIVAVGSVTARRDGVVFLPIPPARVPILLKILEECADKIGVGSNEIQKLIEWKFEDNEPEKKLLYCFESISGYTDETGKMNKKKLSTLVDDGHKNKHEFLNVIDECNKLKGHNKYETSYKTLDCLRNKSPILFKL